MFSKTDYKDGETLVNVPKPYTFGLIIKVRDYECDVEGIVNNANYLHYFEMTRHAYCELKDFSFRRMTEEGLVPVMRRAEIEYLNSLRGSDLFASLLWVERIGPKFVFHQDLYKYPEGDTVSKALTTIVVTRDGRVTRGDEFSCLLSNDL